VTAGANAAMTRDDARRANDLLMSRSPGMEAGRPSRGSIVFGRFPEQ
jgi:hypothetical protein